MNGQRNPTRSFGSQLARVCFMFFVPRATAKLKGADYACESSRSGLLGARYHLPLFDGITNSPFSVYPYFCTCETVITFHAAYDEIKKEMCIHGNSRYTFRAWDSIAASEQFKTFFLSRKMREHYTLDVRIFRFIKPVKISNHEAKYIFLFVM